ncbi:conserved hypothetical protein [Clostridiaceae bacterium BL-3]|nr:conserved hypothetical protein [Clostridiaceae bacterium BL-3]
MDKSELLSELVEVSARPIFQAKNYWHKSVYSTLEARRKAAKESENYALALKADIVSIKRLWEKQLKVIEKWARDEKIPDTDEIGRTIENIERESKTEIMGNKIIFENEDKLNRDELDFIERYSSIEDLNERIASMEEDYLYFRIRDYIILNLFQFLEENREMALSILSGNVPQNVEKISDLICKHANRCMYIDLE